MKNSTKVVLVALAATGLVITVAVLRPRGVHALPTAVNPTSPRTPWSGSCTTSPTFEPLVATCNITTVPADAELVVTNISFSDTTSTPSATVCGFLYTTSGGLTDVDPWMNCSESTREMIPFSSSAGQFGVFLTTPATFYVDPGAVIHFVVEAHHQANLVGTVTVFGYYVETVS